MSPLVLSGQAGQLTTHTYAGHDWWRAWCLTRGCRWAGDLHDKASEALADLFDHHESRAAA